ncbi:activity regulator of membrane protease YbbK [Saccharobesus litoralis]|uniref:Activity regulator of membrane protease YbbK n=1 Tax=Saccharobesus litoralis TaxID=2172099 RepID=A0A2S0VWM3_9ALTE|nr:NfeD family protein [Saccharobesus litoralis]AWB68572.1 activity regulator of membrane protease YbbK [Saccharobesus litoralis]
MFEFISSHVPETLIAVGIILLTIEVAVLGFATFILFFFGISLLITGGAVWLGVLPDSLSAIALSNAIFTSCLALLLWKPLKNIQDKADNKMVKSDFTGLRFFVADEVSLNSKAQHKLSGILWTLKSHEVIPAGKEVEVIRAEVGVLWVKEI